MPVYKADSNHRFQTSRGEHSSRCVSGSCVSSSMLTHTERTGQSGRYFAINREVFPDFARVTINLAPTFAPTEQRKMRVTLINSLESVGVQEVAETQRRVDVHASASRQMSAMHDTASNG